MTPPPLRWARSDEALGQRDRWSGTIHGMAMVTAIPLSPHRAGWEVRLRLPARRGGPWVAKSVEEAQRMGDAAWAAWYVGIHAEEKRKA